MDKLTKQWISTLARKVENLNEQNLVMARSLNAESERTLALIKLLVEMLIPICREDDSKKRGDGVTLLRNLIEMSEPHAQYKVELARAETEHEHHIAEIEALLAELNDLPDDDSAADEE